MIYLVIPAYNEEQNLPGLIRDIGSVMKQTGEEFFIILVDDGSTDKTRDIALELAKETSMEVISHKRNLGANGFFNTGLRKAAELSEPGDIVVVMEADSTSDPALLPDMTRKIREGIDVVIGSRYIKGGGYSRFPVKRLILSLGANFLMKVAFPIKGVKDYTIFYRAYSGETLKKALEVYKDRFITQDSFLVNAEILVNLRRLNIKVEEVPLLYRYELKKSKSRIAVGNTLAEYLTFILTKRFSVK